MAQLPSIKGVASWLLQQGVAEAMRATAQILFLMEAMLAPQGPGLAVHREIEIQISAALAVAEGHRPLVA